MNTRTHARTHARARTTITRRHNMSTKTSRQLKWHAYTRNTGTCVSLAPLGKGYVWASYGTFFGKSEIHAQMHIPSTHRHTYGHRTDQRGASTEGDRKRPRQRQRGPEGIRALLSFIGLFYRALLKRKGYRKASATSMLTAILLLKSTSSPKRGFRMVAWKASSNFRAPYGRLGLLPEGVMSVNLKGLDSPDERRFGPSASARCVHV